MDNTIKNKEKELSKNNPEISAYIHDISLSTAERAFMNTSFSPEKRGLHVRIEYAESLLSDKMEVFTEISKASKRGAELRRDFNVLVDEWFKSHRKKLCDYYCSWLYAHSRVASSFIVGPSNFPVARNQKYSGYADNKLAAIDEFRKKSVKNALKRILPHGDGTTIQTDDPQACNKIQNKIASLEKQREEMKAINKVMRKYFKNGNPEITPDKLSEFKNILRSDFHMNEKQIADLIKPSFAGKVVGFERWQLQNLGANITRYKKRLVEVEKTSSTSIDQEFSNGIRVSISDDQKICIHFGFIPDEETRALLKANAFKFSRHRDNAWVRKLTLNAEGGYRHYIKPKLESLEVA